MAIIPVDDVGTLGIVRDVPGHRLPPEAWSDGRNVRFSDQAVHRALGAGEVYGTPSGSPYWMLQVLGGSELYWIYCDLDAVYVTDGSLHKEITKAATTYQATIDHGWNGGVLNGIPVLNNSFDTPQYWARDFATPSLLADLTGWPPGSGVTTGLVAVMRPFRNFLVGLDYTEDSTRFEDGVIWSHPADPGSVPSSWDYTDPTVDAGRVQLAEKPGAIIDGLNIGNDVFVVYKGEGTWGMQYIGGAPVFRFWKMFDQVGLLSRRCVKEINRRHFVLTLDADLVVHDTRQVVRVGAKKIARWLGTQIDSTNYERSFVAYDPRDKNILVCYPENGEAACTAALTWNIEDGSFGHLELPDLAHIAWGVVSDTTDDTWDADLGTWDVDTSFWDQINFNPVQYHMLYGKPDASAPKLYRALEGTDVGGTAFTSRVERTGLALIGQDRQGRPISDPNVVKYLRSIRPRAESTLPIKVWGLSQMTRDGAVTYDGPHTFDPASQFEVFPSVSGRFLGVAFEFPEGSEASLFGYDLDVVPVGRN